MSCRVDFTIFTPYTAATTTGFTASSTSSSIFLWSLWTKRVSSLNKHLLWRHECQQHWVEKSFHSTTISHTSITSDSFPTSTWVTHICPSKRHYKDSTRKSIHHSDWHHKVEDSILFAVCVFSLDSFTNQEETRFHQELAIICHRHTWHTWRQISIEKSSTVSDSSLVKTTSFHFTF